MERPLGIPTRAARRFLCAVAPHALHRMGYGLEPMGTLSETSVVREIEHCLPSGLSGGAAILAVMCVLSQRLPPVQMDRISGCLPADLRRWVRRCSVHERASARPIGRAALLHRLAEHFGTGEGTAEEIARVVIGRLSALAPGDSLRRLLGPLPQEVDALWPRSAGNR